MVDSDRVSFSPEELAQIDDLIPRGAAQGDRYPSQLMAELDSER